MLEAARLQDFIRYARKFAAQMRNKTPPQILIPSLVCALRNQCDFGLPEGKPHALLALMLKVLFDLEIPRTKEIKVSRRTVMRDHMQVVVSFVVMQVRRVDDGSVHHPHLALRPVWLFTRFQRPE